MKYIGIVIINNTVDDCYYAERSRPYDSTAKAESWIDDKFAEIDAKEKILSEMSNGGVFITDSTIIAIDENRSTGNFDKIISWLTTYTEQN